MIFGLHYIGEPHNLNVKKLNIVLLLCELAICIVMLCGYTITFGHGQWDVVFFGLFYIGVAIHLVWTIRLVIKKQPVKRPAIIFLSFTIFILLKVSFLRGSQFPWDGDLIVNHGRLKPNYGNAVIYSVVTSIGQKDSMYKITMPDPGKRYLTTLWVSDPECTGCDDCMIDSGRVLIPDTLKRYVNDPISSDIIFLGGKSPYQIQDVPYRRYRLKGQVIGVRNGRLVFYVYEWAQR